MTNDHFNHCASCGSSNHHAIECTVGEGPVHYSVMNVECQEETGSATTRGDASTVGDLINFDEDVESLGAQSSETDYQIVLKDLIIDPVKPDLSCELSPATPNYEARFQEDLDEAIRRSLKDVGVHELKGGSHQSCTTKEQDLHLTVDQEQVLSDNEDFEVMVKKSVEKVKGWNVGDESAATSVSIDSEDYHERIDDARHWETKATPKTLKNRELVPKSSFLAFQDTASPVKGHERVKDKKNTFVGPITRTLNPEANTVTVSSLRQKRRDRRNRRSYYEITPELQYLR